MGRTFEELDILFAHRVPAREFQEYRADPYAENDVALHKVEI
jgi:SP family general alpha glucoside:H+ symporter-like MFS transporter